MATWFAQLNANINAANMWNSLPAGGGTVLTWPPASGDVLVANNKTASVNVSVNLGSTGEFRNGTTGGATSGGYFNCTSTGVSITGKGYNDAGGNGIFRVNSAITIYFVGDVAGTGIANSICIYLQTSSPTINITGNIIGGSGSGAHGIFSTSTSTATINITGNVTGGANSATQGIRANTALTISVTGNTIANLGNAIFNNVAGSVSVSGFAEASSNQSAIGNVAQGIVSIGETRSASNGRPAVSGAFRYASTTALIHKPIASDGSTLTMKPVAAFTLPSEATVRHGVSYGADKAGTLTGCNRHHRMTP